MTSPPKPSRRLRVLTVVIWLAVAGLIGWVLSTVPLREVAAVLLRLTLWQIAVILVGNLIILLFFAARWWVILRAQGWHIPYIPLASYRIAAFSLSYFTPGSHFGGEPLQVFLAHRRHGVPLPTATASVALEKLIEMVVNFAFLVMGVAATLQSPIFAGQASAPILAVSLGLLALPAGFLGAVWIGRHPVSAMFSLMPERIRHAQRLARIREGITAAEIDAATLCRERPFALLQALIASLLSWAAMIAEVWIVVYFLGTALSITELVAVMTASRLAILLPAPGGLGTLEASQVWVFDALGYDPALGLGLSLVIHARDLLFGVIGLWWGAAAANRAAQSPNV